MLKKIIIYTVVFLVVGTTSFFLQIYLLGDANTNFFSTLKKAYIFHFCFSLVLLMCFRVLANYDKLFQQLGFIYMGLLVIKIVVFASYFYPQLLGKDALPRFYRASLLIPVIVFLLLEVVFISKIMQGKKA